MDQRRADQAARLDVAALVGAVIVQLEFSAPQGATRPAGRRRYRIGVAVAGAAVIGWGDFAGGPDPLIGDLLAVAGAFGMGVLVCARPGTEPPPGRVPLDELLPAVERAEGVRVEIEAEAVVERSSRPGPTD